MTEENPPPVDNPVDDAADAVPAPDPDPTPDPEPEPSPDGDEDKVLGAIDAMGEKIIGALNSLKEASPVTDPQEQVMDETPLKRPWTHRGFRRG